MADESESELVEGVLAVVEPLQRSLALLIDELRGRLADEEPSMPPGLAELVETHRRAIESLSESLPRTRPELRLVGRDD
jgi:hypothetical protein